jgi:HlyD family secretion protein
MMMMRTNICELLGISSKSTDEEIMDGYIRVLQNELTGKELAPRDKFEHIDRIYQEWVALRKNQEPCIVKGQSTALPRSLSIGIAITAIGSIAVMVYLLRIFLDPIPASTSTTKRPIVNAVTALGRLEPKGEVIQLSAAESSGSNRVEDLLIQQGDAVRSGQIIATLDSKNRRQATLEQVQQLVSVARAKLAKVKSGAKIGEIDSQKAGISRFKAELRREAVARNATVAGLKAEMQNAELEFNRFDSLEVEGAASKSIRDGKRLALDTTRERLRGAIASKNLTLETLKDSIRGAEATLNSITEIRPIDVKLAQGDVDSASASVKQAKADLELSYIRAPREGRILRIRTWPGEIIGNKGIVEIGQTQSMYAVAEIYELDIDKVKVGQRAKIKCLQLPKKLNGTVEQVGLFIDKRDVLNTDPAAEIDSRVVEVKIRLDPEDSSRVAGLTNAKVKVAIHL